MKNELSEPSSKYLDNMLLQARAISELISNVRKLSELKEGGVHCEAVDVNWVMVEAEGWAIYSGGKHARNRGRGEAED